jgi:sulfhydrogenase subunit alpha
MANKSFEIRSEYVTRVEGHGHIWAEVKNGKLHNCRLEITESPRMFEAFVRGREWWELPWITCRICGICSHSHMLTSLRAVENALDVQISDQTYWLRVLVDDAEQLESHILHVAYLVAPDLFRVPSVIPLAESHPEVVKAALRAKRMANDILLITTGHEVHSMRMVVGGFTMWPTKAELKQIKKLVEDTIDDVKLLVKVVADNADKFPAFTRETEYISLKHDKEFPFYDGKMHSSDTKKSYRDEEYREVVNEYVVPWSTCKRSKFQRESYAVGALARCNNNPELITGLAREVADMFGFKDTCCNPYFNNVAQLIEVAYCMERVMRLCDRLLEVGPEKEPVPEIKVRAGRGIGVTEAPRGILFHDYTLDDSGKCVQANCVIPTNQNTGNLEDDMKELVPWLVDKGTSPEEIQFYLEMLMRAYDPCISCSVHTIFL